jgi:RHS repeat-associated protein
MAGRADNSENYRYGFNGKEKDSPGMGGGGSTYDYGFRIYNPSIAKFLSVDPLTKSYPWYTPYQFAGNKPIWAIDLDGLEEYFMTTYLYTLSGNIVKLSQGVVSSDNDWNGVRYGSSYFFEGKEENGSLAYYRQNEEDEGGMGWVKMYKDNKNYFTALRIHHGIQQQQFNQTVVDGVALSASVIGTIASLGASTPLVVITGMTLGVSSSGLSFAKFTLDILGEHERSSEIPDNIGESLGVAFDEVYKKIDENYDGDMGRTIGGYAEALISLGVRNSFSELGLNDALVSSGLVGAWIANTGKSFEDFDKYLEEFNNIMIEYDRILQAEESEE